MIKTIKKDKRLHPRIDQQLPLNVSANGYDFVTQTKNISCIGAYCNIDKYVPPFTRVMVKIQLPGRSHNQTDVEAKGVIVRTEDDATGGYNIAIFFNGIKDSPRQKITQYISQFFPECSYPKGS